VIIYSYKLVESYLKEEEMEELYSVKLSKVIKEFALEELYLPESAEGIDITCSRVNRPGLQIVGFYDYYEQARLQIIGKVENMYLSKLEKSERLAKLDDFFKTQPSGVIYTSSLSVEKEIVALAEK
jgi:HPr kinase/phosphorylase